MGVHATAADGTKFYRELCEGGLGDIMAGRKQSQCQSMTGMRAFRIDEITNGKFSSAIYFRSHTQFSIYIKFIFIFLQL